jgi:FdhD protein
LPSVINVRLLRLNLQSNIIEKKEDNIALDEPIKIHINKRHLVTLFATPEYMKELAFGYLLSEGIIHNTKDIEDIKIKKADIFIKVKPSIANRIQASKTTKVIRSACGSTEDLYTILDRKDKPYVHSKLSIDIKNISYMVRELNLKSSRNRAVHSTGLFLGNALIAFHEDVGRHNAIDKVIGTSALKEINFNHLVLVTTGRQSGDMVLKASRVGIPITVSIRKPMYSGIFSAWRTGVTMIANAKGKIMEIYTHPHRVIIEY